MKLNYQKDIAQWLTEKRLDNFQEIVAKKEDVAFDTLYRGRTGFTEYSEDDILEEINAWNLTEQAIEDDILIDDAEFREYITQCPECGALDSLEVIIGKFWCTGMTLHPDGFDVFETQEFHTEEEIVHCRKCENQFDLETLKYDETEDDD